MTSKIFGYCRVSTNNQNLTLQKDALMKAGCTYIYEEKTSAAQKDRTELSKLRALLREGDKVVVWRLDRLARSMKQLL